jgi:hypothetical protein
MNFKVAESYVGHRSYSTRHAQKEAVATSNDVCVRGRVSDLYLKPVEKVQLGAKNAMTVELERSQEKYVMAQRDLCAGQTSARQIICSPIPFIHHGNLHRIL